MNHFAPGRIRVEKDVITYITRLLRGKGQLYVSIGQEVSPEEIIGSATISSGFRTLNLATLLSVSPQEVKKYLTRKLGQNIYRGELLAYKKGWLISGRRVVTAPTDGVLDFLNEKTGELKIAFLPKKVDLPAGVYGVIERVDQEKGQVIIRTQVTRVYGIFGSGRSREGSLYILGKKDDLVSKEAMQSKFDEHILVGGSLFSKDAISAAISMGVNGIITGGINARDYIAMAGGRLAFPKKLDNDIGISIVVCEGFGVVPLGIDIFEVFRQYEGRFVFIDGNKGLIGLPSNSSSSMVKIRGTKLPLMQDGETLVGEQLRPDIALKAGLNVRVIGNSYPGEQGKLVAINDSLTLLPSGIKEYLATVETSRRKIQVPVANLEVIV